MLRYLNIYIIFAVAIIEDYINNYEVIKKNLYLCRTEDYLIRMLQGSEH
jgi:hypothetical protein